MLLEKLTFMGVNLNLVKWIQDFLTGRLQFVRAGHSQSKIITTNIGLPQGCVLSPLLFILHTNDCVSHHSKCSLIKFADDVALVGLLTDNDQDYRSEIDQFYEWCCGNSLFLNISKTKEMVIDFRKKPLPLQPVTINEIVIETVNEYKYLGTIIDHKLTWSANTLARYSKAQQRLFFLRKLRSFNAENSTLTLFYLTFIQSVVTFAIQCWGGGLSIQNRNMLDKVTKTGRKIIRSDVKSVTNLTDQYTLKLALRILEDPLHPLHTEFSLLPSGCRFRMPRTKTKRHITSFVPRSIQLLNESVMGT